MGGLAFLGWGRGFLVVSFCFVCFFLILQQTCEVQVCSSSGRKKEGRKEEKKKEGKKERKKKGRKRKRKKRNFHPTGKRSL